MKLYIRPFHVHGRGKPSPGRLLINTASGAFEKGVGRGNYKNTTAANKTRGRYYKRTRKDWKEHVRLAQEKGRLAQKEATKYMTASERIEYYKRKKDETWREKANRNKNSSEESKAMRITDDKVIKLRHDYKRVQQGLVTFQQLAVMYGISKVYCIEICRGIKRRNIRSKKNE